VYTSSLTHTFFDLRFHDLVLSRFFGRCLVLGVQISRGGGGIGNEGVVSILAFLRKWEGRKTQKDKFL
jgi:hypothetical protein